MKDKVLQIQKLNAQTSIQLQCINIKILNLVDAFLFQDFFKAHDVEKIFTTPIIIDYLQPTINVNHDIIYIIIAFDCFNCFCKNIASVFC